MKVKYIIYICGIAASLLLFFILYTPAQQIQKPQEEKNRLEKIELYRTFTPDTVSGKPVYFFYKITVDPDNLIGRISFAVRIEGKEPKSYANFDKLYPSIDNIKELDKLISSNIASFDTLSGEPSLNYTRNGEILSIKYKDSNTRYISREGEGQALAELYTQINSLVSRSFREKMEKEKTTFIQQNTVE